MPQSLVEVLMLHSVYSFAFVKLSLYVEEVVAKWFRSYFISKPDISCFIQYVVKFRDSSDAWELLRVN